MLTIVSTNEAASLLGISPHALQMRRIREGGRHPRPIVIGGRFFYEREDVLHYRDAWRDRRMAGV